MDRNYWGYRIDTQNRKYFFDEINKGFLRQGWGYKDNQDLRLGDKTEVSARRNFPIYNKVKKGDILLIPRIESWDEIAIVEATENFNSGYKFSINPEIGDYGHMFPVKLKQCFSRHNINVDGDIRETLKCRSRFWNINRCAEQIEKILNTPPEQLKEKARYGDSFRKRVEEAFNEEAFAEQIYQKLNSSFQSSEWEYILCEGFKKLCPDKYSIETTPNSEEKKHGADIIIRIPGILNTTYIIAIQVKDYMGEVSEETIAQISKANEYFMKEEGSTLIDKYLIITKGKETENTELLKKAVDAGVKVLFDRDVEKLLAQMGRAYIGDSIME